MADRNAVEDLVAARAEIEAMKEKLSAKEVQLEAIRIQRATATAAVDAARADLHAQVSAVVDIQEIEKCRAEMQAHENREGIGQLEI